MKIQYSCLHRLQHNHVILLFFFLLSITGLKAQKEFDGQHSTQNWIGLSDAPNALYHHIANETNSYLNARSATIAKIHSLADWQKRQAWTRKTLHEVIGPFPPKTPLNALVTRTIEKEGFHLENIIFESQPGYYVTATLFIPSVTRNVKAPAIIYLSGHSDNGYRTNGYQQEILNFVKKGFIVFAIDPIGQGERLQYYNPTTKKSAFKWPAFEHSYVGAQLFLTGNTLARNFIWDGIRAVDYLITRKEVDADRIGMTGRSGGGTQTAYIAALDERIKAAAPENYITNYKWLFQAMGPQDAEQVFFYGIQKGLDMADLLELRAPKPTLVVTTSQDMFPIQGARETVNEVSNIYEAYGKGTNFSMVSDDAPHASTKNNREASYTFFQKALNNPGNSKEEEIQILTADELRVSTTGQVATSFNGESAYGMNYKDAERKMKQLETSRKNYPGYIQNIIQSAKELSGYRQPKETALPAFTGRIQKEGYVIEKYLLKGEGDYMIPYLMLIPAIPNHKALIYLDPAGKTADLQPGGDMEWLVKNGTTVLAPDIIGTGELGPGEFKGDSYIDSVSYNIWFATILNGRSIVGIQASDVVRLVDQLKGSTGINQVYGLAKKQFAPLLLHAAAFDKDIRKVTLIAPFSSYRSMAMNPRYDPKFLHSTVAGAVGVYDLPDLAAGISPGKLLIINMTDGNGDAGNTADMQQDIQVIRKAYQDHDQALQIVTGIVPGEWRTYLQAWLN